MSEATTTNLDALGPDAKAAVIAAMVEPDAAKPAPEAPRGRLVRASTGTVSPEQAFQQLCWEEFGHELQRAAARGEVIPVKGFWCRIAGFTKSGQIVLDPVEPTKKLRGIARRFVKRAASVKS